MPSRGGNQACAGEASNGEAVDRLADCQTVQHCPLYLEEAAAPVYLPGAALLLFALPTVNRV